MFQNSRGIVAEILVLDISRVVRFFNVKIHLGKRGPILQELRSMFSTYERDSTFEIIRRNIDNFKTGEEKFWISSDNEPIKWLLEASNHSNVRDEHPDKFLRNSGNLITTELFSSSKTCKLQRLPRYSGIPSNMLTTIDEEELRNEGYGYMTCDNSHRRKLK
ncbi:hypothetical protein LXL04_014641 [Taraxacum kok-saghyz]